MRIAALGIISTIAFTIVLPARLSPERTITDAELGGLFLCVVCIVVIILSDRIVSLDFSKNQLRIKLSDMRQELEETVKEVQEALEGDADPPSSASLAPSSSTDIDEGLSEAQEKLKRVKEPNSKDDPIKEAQEIADSMRMLREIAKRYKEKK